MLMVRSILTGVICCIFLCYSAISKAADQGENYCPEEDFVRLCLAPIASETEMREWVQKNKWAWQDFPDRLLKNYSIIEMYKRDALRGKFMISILEFSDLTEINCHLRSYTYVFLESPRICNLNFPAITEELGDNFKTNNEKLTRGSTKTWEFRTDRTRGNTIVSFDKTGKVNSFWATKYIFKQR